MKFYPDTPEGFAMFLADGHERSRLYRPGEGKAVESPKDSNVVSPGRLAEPLKNIEEVDFKLKAAGEDDWDGAEVVEDQPE